jgi:hypothetical protein
MTTLSRGKVNYALNGPRLGKVKSTERCRHRLNPDVP